MKKRRISKSPAEVALFRVVIPDDPKRIMQILIDAGFEAYVVGGCIRDSYLGKEPHDWDICTSALPEQIQECFRGYVVLETGLKHGTLTVLLHDNSYEVTTFRTDGEYTDHRHPDTVQFVGTLKEDLKRRDFTINAMAAGIDGKIIDYFDGRNDLEHRLIRCVGTASDRFQEDALRILRAMRFAARFGFAIEEKTEQAMRKNKKLLEYVSAERVNKELSGILMGDCYAVLRCFPDVLAVWIPEIMSCVDFWQRNPYHHKDVWNHIVSAIDAAPKDLYVRLALLYHDIGKPQCFTMEDGIGHFYGHAAVSMEIAENSLKKLRYDNQTIKSVTQLVEAHDRTIEPRKPVIRRCLNKFGREQLLRLLDVKEADYSAQMNLYGDRLHKAEIIQMMDEILEAQKQQEECFSLKDLAINGNDLISIGYQPGKLIGICLDALLFRVMEGTLENDKEVLLQAAKDYVEGVRNEENQQA